MNERKKEIRKFLVGAFTEGKDGIEASRGIINPFASSRRGTLSAYLFGVTAVKREIFYRGRIEKIATSFYNAFTKSGRKANLAEAPDALCAVVLPLIRAPYVFTFESDGDGEGILIYYSARGIFARIKGIIRIKKMLRLIDPELLVSVQRSKRNEKKSKDLSKEEKDKIERRFKFFPIKKS